MRVRVLVFAVLRERLGFSERTIDLLDGATVGDAARVVLGSAEPRGVAFAVNRKYARAPFPLKDGDEVAFLPPVSGGLPSLRVQRQPIDVQALLAEVGDGSCGAVLLFLGTAREVPGDVLEVLEYEAYPEMAERFFAEVAAEIRERFAVERVAIVHRTGRLTVGEASVAIAVASPHRSAGFEALRHAIERIKEAAPVWKKEVTRRGERWVESEGLEGG